jgi:hypothetical protein
MTQSTREDHVGFTLRSVPFRPERQQADEALVNIENLQTILEDWCHRLRRKINSHGL